MRMESAGHTAWNSPAPLRSDAVRTRELLLPGIPAGSRKGEVKVPRQEIQFKGWRY